MKYYSSESTYSYKWDHLAVAFWKRYPNPYSKHVLSLDVVDRHFSPDGTLRSKRLLVKTGRAPRWAERVLSLPSCVYVIEESIVDVKRRILTTYTRNINHQKFMTIDEKVVYSPSIDNPSATTEKREAWINSTLSYGLATPAQMFAFDRFKKNVNKTYRGFQYVLDNLYNADSPLKSKSQSLDQQSFAHQLSHLATSAASAGSPGPSHPNPGKIHINIKNAT